MNMAGDVAGALRALVEAAGRLSPGGLGH